MRQLSHASAVVLLTVKYCFIWILLHSKIISLILSQVSLGGVKIGDPRGKTPDTLQAELGFSHIWPELGLNPVWWDDERFRAPKISILSNHSATGAASIKIDA